MKRIATITAGLAIAAGTLGTATAAQAHVTEPATTDPTSIVIATDMPTLGHTYTATRTIILRS